MSKIDGVIIRDLKRYTDNRGWLVECYRNDEIPEAVRPAMSYISVTLPGIARGPHEHVDQTDYFCFPGTSAFELHVWDNRAGSKTKGLHETHLFAEGEPHAAIVPPGVVHGYKNVGNKDGVVVNFPNRLFAGEGKKQKIDEIRYENDPGSAFKL